MNDQVRSMISAVKPRRVSGSVRAKKYKRGGENVRWKRITQVFEEAKRAVETCPPDRLDELIRTIAVGAKIDNPLARAVFFGHLTTRQGIAARFYAFAMKKFERYHLAGAQRSARAQVYESTRKGADDEIQRHLLHGTIADYERDARKAKRDYNKITSILARYADPITGRNVAKDVLDNMVLGMMEPPAQYRENLAAVLEAMAKAFDITERRK